MSGNEKEDAMKLLLIEDDATTADYVTRGLREEGHTVDHLANGREGLTQALAGEYDVMIVDRMLPELDGLSIVRAVRAAKVATPVIFLTAIGGVDDRIEGLNAGGDDYLVKPFEYEVHTIGVDPAYQGQGIGRQLLRRLFDFAGDATIFLEVRTDNAAAIALYESEGFEQVGLRKRYYRVSGADAYTMKRDRR
jgi:ribosomal protein S18 acetylase RimI-like enzyme